MSHHYDRTASELAREDRAARYMLAGSPDPKGLAGGMARAYLAARHREDLLLERLRLVEAACDDIEDLAAEKIRAVLGPVD